MNPWISRVKAYKAKHGCSYKEAMQKSKATYKKGSGLSDMFPKNTSGMMEEPKAEAGGPHLIRIQKEQKAAREAADMAARMDSLPKKPDGRIYAGMRPGDASYGRGLSSANKAYWKMNRDLFNATYGPMSKAAMSLYGF